MEKSDDPIFPHWDYPISELNEVNNNNATQEVSSKKALNTRTNLNNLITEHSYQMKNEWKNRMIRFFHT